MIRHVVMMKLKPCESEEEKISNTKKLKNAIDGLTGKIPELKSMETGMNINTKPSAYDLVLISDFETEDDLDSYRVHPEHKKVLDILFAVTEKTAVVDYQI